MGKCFGCNKKLGLFEGYSTNSVEFCKNCFPKRKEILEREKIKREEKQKEEKKEQEKIEKEELKETEVKSIEFLKRMFKKKEKELSEEIINKKLNKLSEENKTQLIKKIEKYRSSKNCFTIVFIVGIIVYLFLGRIDSNQVAQIGFGVLFLILIFILWIIRTFRKSLLLKNIEELKLIED